MLSCKEVSQLVSQAQDRSLTLKERMAVRMHLLMCSMCRRYQKQLAFLTKAGRNFLCAPCKDDYSLPEKAKTRIEKAVEQATLQPKSKKDNADTKI